MGLKSKLPFHRKSLLYLIALLSSLLLFFILFQHSREKKYKVDVLNSDLQLFNNQLNAYLEDGDDIDWFINKYKPTTVDALRVTLIDTLGKVILDSDLDDVVDVENHRDRPEFVEALKSGRAYTLRRASQMTDQEYFYSASFFENIVIRSAVPYNGSLVQMLATDSYFYWFMLLYAILIGILFFLVTRKLSLDVERLQQSEQSKLKKELTHNISHELKTPVSSIRGYLETIINNPGMDDTTKSMFISRSFDQTTRLTNLLADISTITRMDEAADKIEKSKVNLSDIVKEVVGDEELAAKSKGFVIENFLPENMIIKGNASLLHSIFYNLIDNAVAYSGGNIITIKLYDDDLNIVKGSLRYRISVSDNGVGIADEHLDRIFERFYRVDKGRSRKQGGTGLGLSIVKNAVMIHGGVIFARNIKDGGMEFVFTL